MTFALAGTRRSRRTILRLAGGATIGAVGGTLTACTGSGGPSSSPTGAGSGADRRPRTDAGSDPPIPDQPSVSTFPGSEAGAAVEDALAAHAATLLAVGSRRLGSKGRSLVTAIRDLHFAHAAALRTVDPTDPGSAGTPTTAPTPTDQGPGSTPSSTPGPGLAQAVQKLQRAESAAAATHRATALATDGLATLLWGSMATSAAAVAAGLRRADLAGDDPEPDAVRIAAVRARAPMPVITVVEAEQEMVRQLHAVIYGYQLALGRLTGARRDTASAELRRHRILRDRLTARLLNREAEVPVADAAYVPSTNPRSASTAAKLIRQMETALMPFCGLWLAAAAIPTERTESFDQLARTAGVARRWGASLSTWPGWQLA